MSSQGLTPTQLATYHETGYLLLPSFLPGPTVSSLMAETHRLLSTIPLATHPLTTFSTGEGGRPHVSDRYFLTSGNKIRFFFEEDAFSSVQLSRPAHMAINKIGHALHAHSPPFRDATLSGPTCAIARSLGFRDPRVLQSMLICKQPQIGAAVPAHQDSEFLYTDPPSAVAFWIALEDATANNGALSFARGSHRRRRLRRRFVRTGKDEEEGGGPATAFVAHWEGARFPAGEERDEGAEPDDGEEYTLEEVKAGTLVLIHGNLLHKSESNTSERSRFAYTFHVIEGENQYDGRNWLQPSEAGFTKLYNTTLRPKKENG